MAKRRNKKTGRFAGIPFEVGKTKYFANLKGPEVKLLVDLLLQYNGKNNGSLSACHTLIVDRGWAQSSLHRAFNKLQHKGFLVVTRQGWKCRGKPTLVAITWASIDDPRPNIQYDDGIVPSQVPLGYWFKPKSAWDQVPRVKEILPQTKE